MVERTQVEISGRVEVKVPKSRHGRRRVPISGRLMEELREQGRAPHDGVAVHLA